MICCIGEDVTMEDVSMVVCDVGSEAKLLYAFPHPYK